MVDTYTRQRLDGLAVDMAATRSTVEAIDRRLIGLCTRLSDQESRLKKAERRVFAIWVLGPVLLGVVTLLRNFTGH